MGKTKIQVIDDSAPVEEKKGKPSKKEQKERLDTGNSKLDIETGSSKMEDQPSNIQPQDLTSSLQRPASKSKKPGKAKPRSKKYREVSKDLDRTKSYPIDEAVDLLKKISYAKFNATIEAHINTAQTGLHGFLQLPYAAGKTEYKTEAKAPVIHMALGKLNQPTEELAQNIKVLLSTLGKSKIKKVSLSPTMGPSVKIDLVSVC